jgi:dTDP-4-amino-4,6-dideoxygalactose transaminase
MKTDKRDEIITCLDKNGIEASPVHCRNDTYTAFVQCTMARDSLESVDQFDRQMLCIPVGEWLTDEDAEKIVQCLRKG